MAVGSRVRVRFAGRLIDGWVVERAASSDHAGKLAPIAKSVSAEPVLTAEIAGLARAVADRWAGTMSDVLRLAVPPRHARVEAEPTSPAPLLPDPPEPGEWHRYAEGAGFVTALVEGRPARAVWRALPGPTWSAAVATAAQATLAAGRGVVIVVPDSRDLAHVDTALTSALGAGRHVALTADLGPAQRYRRWLAVLRGGVRCVVGTRAAAWAPVRDLGLVVCWDDGDDLHKEPRAPYPHVRDVLVLRAHRTGAGALVGGLAPSVEAELLVARRWASLLSADRATIRSIAPRVDVAGDDVQLERDAGAASARLPSVAWQAARAALADGRPVLVQVPRTGYQPTMACRRCRAAARCPACAGPLGRHSAATRLLACRWCGRPAADWTCPACGSAELRAVVVGSGRTAEELGRAFPGVPVRTSDRDSGVVPRVTAAATLVVATPGAEPVADGGYGVVLLLDGRAMLGRADLRAAEEALRRWLAAAALARPATEGGRVVVMADASLGPVQALVRWDPGGFARREYLERRDLGLPPAVRMASLDGRSADVSALLAAATLPASADVLGPVPHGDGERMLVRVPRDAGDALAAALHAAMGVLSARKATGPVRVELDPLSPG